MPTYTFKVEDGAAGLEDATGVCLDDREQALRYAHRVIHELANCRELETRLWRFDVYEDDQRIFEIPFASIDPTLDHLDRRYRSVLEKGCESQRALQNAIYAARLTVQESRALVARSRGKPYLASRFGTKIIRD